MDPRSVSAGSAEGVGHDTIEGENGTAADPMTIFVIFLVGCFLSYQLGRMRMADFALKRLGEAEGLAKAAVADLAQAKGFREEGIRLLEETVVGARKMRAEGEEYLKRINAAIEVARSLR